MTDADQLTPLFARPEQARPLVRDRHVRGLLAAASVFALAACTVGTDAPKTELGQRLNATIDDEAESDPLDSDPNVLAADEAAGTEEAGAGAYTQYIALGDSYSAGTGSTTDTKGCGLSPEAWPYKVASGLGSGPKFVHGACSGAKTSDVLTKQIPTVKQAGRDASTLITVTVGGNDAKLAWEFIQCGIGMRCTLNLNTIQKRIDQIGTQLAQTFTQLKAAAPAGATIVAVGYPHLLAPSTDAACNRSVMGTVFFSRQRRTDFNKAVDAMNLAIRNAANTAQIGSITTEIVSAFAGHGACSTTPWIHEGSVSKAPSSVGLGHPNMAGEAAYAQAVLSALSTRFRIAAVTPTPEAEPLPGSEGAPGSEPLPGSESLPGSEPLPGSEALPGAGSTPGSLPGFEAAAESAAADSEAGIDPEADIDPEAEVDPAANVDPEADVDPAANVDPEAELDPEAGDGSAEEEYPGAEEGSAEEQDPEAGDGSAEEEYPGADEGSAEEEYPGAGEGSAEEEYPGAGEGSAEEESPEAGEGSAEEESPEADGSEEEQDPESYPYRRQQARR